MVGPGTSPIEPCEPRTDARGPAAAGYSTTRRRLPRRGGAVYGARTGTRALTAQMHAMGRRVSLLHPAADKDHFAFALDPEHEGLAHLQLLDGRPKRRQIL